MKRFLILILATALSVTVSAGEWQPLTSGTEQAITGLSFPHPDTGFFVTHGGELGTSFDAGDHWTVMPVDSTIPLESVHFYNGRRGLACGRNGGLMLTVDGGETWENHNLGDTKIWLISVRFVDSMHAVAVGMDRENGQSPHRGVLLTSDDGGRTWKRHETTGVEYGNLYVSQNRNVYFQSWGYLHMSQDRGRTWRAIKTLDGKPGRATAIMDNSGVLVGNYGMAAWTQDNGRTWQPSVPDSTTHYTGVAQLTTDSVFIAGHKAVVMVSADGGQTWKHDLPPDLFDIYELQLAGYYLYIAGTKGKLMRLKIR
jgi:photosystem II stability/assembly factor-like uncharacterized protein